MELEWYMAEKGSLVPCELYLKCVQFMWRIFTGCAGEPLAMPLANH